MKTINYVLLVFGIGVMAYLTWDSVQHIRAEVLHRNGHLKREQGYPHLALPELKKSVELMPWEAHYRLQLAKTIQKTAQLFPDTFNAYMNDAIEQYEHLIQMDWLNPWYCARLGLIYYEMHQKFPSESVYKDNALFYTKKAANLDHKNPLFSMHYAHLLLNYGDYTAAEPFYLRTIEYDERMVEAHHNLVLIYEALNQPDKKLPHLTYLNNHLTDLEQNLTLVPAQSNAYKQTQANINKFMINRSKLSALYIEQHQPTAARTLIETLPVSIDRYELLARYHAQFDQPNIALKLYQELKKATQSTAYDAAINALTTQ